MVAAMSQCKKCNAAISLVVMAETIKKIEAICEGLGMDYGAAYYVAHQQGPLCRKRMQHWGAGEDDLESPHGLRSGSN